ncbi:ABC transporter permease [Oceanicella sp. SM1341]|uniref:ABC transporter permease n=1 Tax=Oceanicella sp. SM1341 TaxID=1548889 RepID=UPI0013007117|nr:ABC transporter permease [Oceanicella sp. SM1341]
MADTGAPGSPPLSPPLSPAPQIIGRPRFQWLRVQFALILREMTTTYSKSTGGYAWAILEPLGAITLLALVFSAMIRTPSLGTSFMLFYGTGYLTYQMYSQLHASVSGAVGFNRSLMQYPAVTPIDAVISRSILNFLTLCMTSFLLLTGIILFDGLQVNLDLVNILSALGMAALLGVGIGTLNCVLFTFFPTWQRIWGIAMRPLFILSGVFYIPEDLPAQARAVLEWNPVMHCVARMRSGFYGAYRPDFIDPIYVCGIGASTLVIGLYLLRRHKSDIVNPKF